MLTPPAVYFRIYMELRAAGIYYNVNSMWSLFSFRIILFLFGYLIFTFHVTGADMVNQ